MHRSTLKIGMMAMMILSEAAASAAPLDADGYFNQGVEQYRAGKLDQAYLTNLRAIELGHLAAIYNSACIAALKKRKSVAVYWLAFLWQRIHLHPGDRERYTRKLTADEDLRMIRSDKDFTVIEAVFRGSVQVSHAKGTEVPRNGKGFLEDGAPPDWRGIVLHLPAKARIKANKVSFAVQTFIMEDPLAAQFSTRRDIVATDSATNKTYRGSFIEMVENEHEIPMPFDPPALAGAESISSTSGGTLNLVISGQLRLPAKPASYKIHIETDFYRSNVAELEVVAN